MNFSFHPEAEEEFLAAIDYHEERENGLGLDFSIEIYAAIQLIVAHPNAWPVLEEDVRRCLVNRFPYGILYAIAREEIVILAAMHQRRRPDYWKDRAGVL